EGVLGDTAVQHVVTTTMGDLLAKPKGWLVDFVVRYVKKMVPPWSLPGSIRFRSALARGRALSLEPVELGYADIAFLQYTGGTTGPAKGAMLSHRNIVFNLEQSEVWKQDVFEGVERIVVITALPLYHIFSLQSNCLGMA